MNLIIVESPTKARTLSRFLGSDYSVEATMGHIKDLPKSKLGIEVDKNFEPDYSVVETKSKSISTITSRAGKADNIFLATDPDREGEAIAQHVKEVLINDKLQISNDKLKRIVFHEITKEAVEEALLHPRNIDDNLVDAQIARRVLDRLVGYKLSPLLWKKIRRGLSAGRVQSVTVRLIVEREREIKAFVPVEFWEIWCNVKCQMSNVKCNPFDVKLIKIDGKKVEIKDGKTAKEVVANLEKSDYKVYDVKKREVKKSPYPPFTTSTMTQAGARLFGWSAKKTMSLAQKLYEEGLITYHRTDSMNVSPLALNKTRDFIGKEFGANYLPEKARLYKTKSKVAQEAHEAIRPTNVAELQAQSSKLKAQNLKDHWKLYELIWRRFVACQMAASVYDETVIDVEAKKHGDVGQYLLRASGQVMKFDGWRRVMPPSKDKEPQLPEVEKDEALDLIKVDPQQKFTEPPPRYNEASLIKTLEKLGIGRPSTYAPIITTIQVRQYVEKNEGKFNPTPIGFAVNDFLIKNFQDIVDYSFTAQMEDDLDNIAKGTRKWAVMMKDFYEPFDSKLEEVTEKAKRVKIETEKLGKMCPTCEKEGRTGEKQGELVIRVGRFGKFISCSNFPECKHTERYVEKLDMKCPECGQGEVIVKRTRRGGQFFGCSRYPDCKWASWRKPQMKESAPTSL